MKVLVPIDFTAVTENALKFAIGLSESLPIKNITLFHVVASEKDSPVAFSNLNKLIDKYKGTTQVILESHIAPGNIFDKIGSTAADLKASLIVMGTHGIKGMQHIIGSKAMRVITHSETPYIVVQHKPYKHIEKILVPVDYTQEGKQMLPLLEKINDTFKSTLVLIKQKSKDDHIAKKINNNLGYFKSVLNDGSVKCIESGSFTSSSKYKDVLQEANSTNTDLIVTTIDPETNITDYIMGVEEQKLVANESGIPVLCVNIKNFMRKKGNIFELL